MHELGDHPERGGGGHRAHREAPVACVRVRVGRLAGVVPDAMRFCFELVTAGTPLRGRGAGDRPAGGRGRCRTCGDGVRAVRPDPAVRLRQRRRRGARRPGAGGGVRRHGRNRRAEGGDMCGTCGCGETRRPRGGARTGAPATRHRRTGTAHEPVPGVGRDRDRAAGARTTTWPPHNREWLAERGIVALNLMSSPGSGKTSLLCRTITELAPTRPVAVVEGDQETRLDAERIRGTGRARRPDQHRRRLPPRRRHAGPRPGGAAAARRVAGLRGERRATWSALRCSTSARPRGWSSCR